MKDLQQLILFFLFFVFFHQEFKVLILPFSVFVVVASGATVYKSGADEKKLRWQADTFRCTLIAFRIFKTNDILQQANFSALVT